MTFPIFNSHARDWRGLSQDLLLAISRLEALNRKAPLSTIGRSILLTVGPEQQDIRIEYCGPAGQQITASGQSLAIHFAPLPVATDVERDDGSTPPNASIDRAISKAAVDMLNWTKDPDTFELIEHQRYQLYLRWSGSDAAEVYEWAYGLWDE
jgi:hypothetical protein